MATSVPYHARCVSLPSRPHPIKPQFDEYLSRLKSSLSASNSSSRITQKLHGLKDLYESVDDLLLLPSNSQALAHVKSIDDVLEGSLSLLDVCGASRELLSQMKQSLQEIQYVLRRRHSGDLSITKEVAAYLRCKKMGKKGIKNLFKEIKNVEKKCRCYLEKTHGNDAMVNALMEMEMATAEIFGSLLEYITGKNARPIGARWSLMSKLMHQGQNNEATFDSEFEEIDDAMESMIREKSINVVHLENVPSFNGRVRVDNPRLGRSIRVHFQMLS